MKAITYDRWSQYYDPENREITTINRVLRDYCGISTPWKGMRVLEIGCGTGRFTKKIINEVEHIDAIDPDIERMGLLNSYLSSMHLDDKCTTSIGTLSDFLKTCKPETKYNLIIFSWSWAFIPDEQKEENLLGVLGLLVDDGIIISTMVETSECEEISYKIRSMKNKNLSDDLKRNEMANERLREILLDKPVFLSETMISTYFQFDDFASVKNTMFMSLPEEENISEADVDAYFHSNPIVADVKTGQYRISDVVRCIAVKRLPKNTPKAKITFNHKLCDNIGECSAAKSCREYRSAIIRVTDDADTATKSGRWGILPERCNPELCGKKCASVCELYVIHRFWPEVYESLREIEQTAIEPDFFDKDRFGSGSYNPDHKTNDFHEACACLDRDKAIQILEVSDGGRHASSFDSVLITDLISRSYYDRYFTKYDIPITKKESPHKVTLFERDTAHEDMCKRALKEFELDELPALLIISFGKIIFRHQGIVRSVDTEVVKKLTDAITEVLRLLSEEA